MGFAGKPDEFQYHAHKDDQAALFVTALRTHNVGCSCPWKDVEIVAKVYNFIPFSSFHTFMHFNTYTGLRSNTICCFCTV